MNTQTRNSLLLLLCSFIWGTAFVAQSAGSGMGAYSFLAGRSWLAVLVLIAAVFAAALLMKPSPATITGGQIEAATATDLATTVADSGKGWRPGSAGRCPHRDL